jgi:glycosyltransferase involved in cell wall biosynthesis
VSVHIGEWEPPEKVDVVIVDRGWQGVYQHAIDLWHQLNRDYVAVLVAPFDPLYGFDPALRNRLITPALLNGEPDLDGCVATMSIARTLMRKLKPRLAYISHRAIMPFFFDIAEDIPTIIHGDLHFDDELGSGAHLANEPFDDFDTLQRLYYAQHRNVRDPLTEAIAGYRASKNAKELWFWTDDQLQRAYHSHGALAERFRVVLPLIDGSRFSPTPDDSPEPIILFSTTNLGDRVYEKGLAPVTRALADLPPGVKLRAVVTRREDVSPQILAMPNVEVLSRIPKTEMLDVYRSARIYCRISREDSSPVSVLEAMVSGVPVMVSPMIARNIPVIIDGHNGFVVDPDNSEDIAAKLRMVVENRELRMEMGRFARQAALPYTYQANRWMFDRYLQPVEESAPATHVYV